MMRKALAAILGALLAQLSFGEAVTQLVAVNSHRSSMQTRSCRTTRRDFVDICSNIQHLQPRR